MPLFARVALGEQVVLARVALLLFGVRQFAAAGFGYAASASVVAGSFAEWCNVTNGCDVHPKPIIGAMRARLLIALFAALALRVGAALGFLLEQASQPTEPIKQQMPDG
jgi:hypothetical protein